MTALSLDAFRADKKIPISRKNLGSNRIELRQVESRYFVSFTVPRDPDERYAGGDTEDEADVTYAIDKADEGSITDIYHK